MGIKINHIFKNAKWQSCTKLWGTFIAQFCLRFSSCATFGNSDFGNLGGQFEHVTEIVWTCFSVCVVSVPSYKFLKIRSTVSCCFTAHALKCSQSRSTMYSELSATVTMRQAGVYTKKHIAPHWTLPPKQFARHCQSFCQIYDNCDIVHVHLFSSSSFSSIAFFASFVFLFFDFLFYEYHHQYYYYKWQLRLLLLLGFLVLLLLLLLHNY